MTESMIRLYRCILKLDYKVAAVSTYNNGHYYVYLQSPRSSHSTIITLVESGMQNG
jgi:hypothetical protein